MANPQDPSPSPAEDPGHSRRDNLPPATSRELSAEDLIALNEEIAGMARAGLPLDQGLAALAREMGRGRLQRVTRQLADDLAAGFTLPQALQRQDGRVPPYYAALLAAAIRSGRIGEVLGTLTVYARFLADFRNAVVSALIYPTIVLVLGMGLLVFTGMLVLPAYAGVFEQMRLRLPLVTQMLVFIGQHPLEIVVLPVVVVILGPALARWLLRFTAKGRMIWARLVYTLPLFGTLLRSARLAAFVELLGILVDQSIPLPEALRLAGEASNDPLLTTGSRQAEQDLNQGLPLGQAIGRQRLVPELVLWMIGFGERQGTLGAALHHVALLYRRQADARAALLQTVLPPLLILGLAVLLATLFVAGLLTPMLSLLEELGGGKKR